MQPVSKLTLTPPMAQSLKINGVFASAGQLKRAVSANLWDSRVRNVLPQETFQQLQKDVDHWEQLGSGQVFKNAKIIHDALQKIRENCFGEASSLWDLASEKKFSPWLKSYVAPVRKNVSVEDLVKVQRESGATTPITDVIIWNSGMSRARLVKGVRALSQRLTGDDQAIGLITIKTEDDLEAGLRGRGDLEYEMKGKTASETYTNLDQFRKALRFAVQQARKTRGDSAQVAVAVGWGYIAEKSEAARIAQEEGVIFVGPPEQAIEDLGDKDKGKASAEKNNVPNVPGSDGIVETWEQAVQAAEACGYPAFVKAVAGGGGKGIRLVRSSSEMKEAFFQAQSEGLKSFGNAALIVEKLIDKPRHIEVQLMADQYGNCVSLGERDCSFQRNHQKEVEMSAHATVPLEVLKKMRWDAVRMAKSHGYVGAGTMEFLYDPKTESYYFLEMNTRLQVEHPVTEGDTGFDLVSLQFAMAAGVSLMDIFSPAQVDRLMEEIPDSFTMAARLIARDGWTGQSSLSEIKECQFPEGDTVRVNTSLQKGSRYTGNTDSQVAHIFVTQPNFAQSLSALIQALKDTKISGIENNINFLLALLQSPEVQSNQGLHTKFIDNDFLPRNKSILETPPDLHAALIGMAIGKYRTVLEELKAEHEKNYNTGVYNPKNGGVDRLQSVELSYQGNNYRCDVVGDDLGHYEMKVFAIEGKSFSLLGRYEARCLKEPGEGWRLHLDGKIFPVDYDGDEVSINRGPKISFLSKDPDTFYAFMPGKIVSVPVKPGDEVKKGQVVCVVEASKMENPIVAEKDGVVASVSIALGDIVKKNKVLLAFESSGVKLKGPMIQFPKVEKSELDFEKMAEMIFSGIPSLGDEAESALETKAQLKQFRESAETTADYVLATLALVEKFVSREKRNRVPSEKDKPSAAESWSYAASRSTLKRQVDLVYEILRSYSSLKPQDVASDVRLLDRLSETLLFVAQPLNGTKEFNRLQLEARRLKDQFFPTPKKNVVEEVKEIVKLAASNPYEVKKRMAALVNYPESIVQEVSSLLKEGDLATRETIGRILLLRTYKSYPIESDSFSHQDQLALFTFKDRFIAETRQGVGLFVNEWEVLSSEVSRAYEALTTYALGKAEMSKNVIEIFCSIPEGKSQEEFTSEISSLLETAINGVRPKRVTVLTVSASQKYPRILTFRPQENGSWQLDNLHSTHPIHDELLELYRFPREEFDLKRLPSTAPQVHLFQATSKKVAEDVRLSVRTIISKTAVMRDDEGLVLPSVDDAFAAALENLSRTALSGDRKTNNNVLLHVEEPLPITYEEIEGTLRRSASRHAREIYDLAGLKTVEVVCYVVDPQDREGRGFKKIIATLANPTGGKLRIKTFVVASEKETGSEKLVPLSEFIKKRSEPNYSIPFKTLRDPSPYKSMTKVDALRAAQEAKGSYYVYDTPKRAAQELREIWQASGQEMPADALVMKELVLNDSKNHLSGMAEVDRLPAQNKISVVGWDVTVKLPGGKVSRSIFGANDQAIQNGSMDMADDQAYAGLCYKAVQLGIPFAFNFGGSGARMAPNAEVISSAQYDAKTGELFLSPDLYEKFKDQVFVTQGELNGANAYRVTGIKAVNQSSLRGSGLMIAASIDVSEAVPTLALAMGDSVTGKQSYAYRMLIRTIQRMGVPILLTGKEPINAGLARVAYDDNLQIGGPEVHSQSGVTHDVVADVQGGLKKWLQWLRYLPEAKPSVGSKMNPTIPAMPKELWEQTPQELGELRDVEALLLKGDKPLMIPGEKRNPIYKASDLANAIFDADSFQETNSAYSPNVVTGYARIGEKNVAVIMFEPGTKETTLPLDPAKPESEAIRKKRWAGRVWGPEGAHKTSDFISELHSQDVPLVIMPNIRGFLGDATALLNEVMKYGADIARRLRHRNQRVVCWLPPYAELRGGAEVVIDPNINPGQIVFLLDPLSILGVLEPEMMFGLPKVKRMAAEFGQTLSADQGRNKILKGLQLSDTAEVANAVGQFHGVVPTKYARNAIYHAAFGQWWEDKP